ncbi:4-hydroxyphenylpyruvate dioxygenase [Kamptonema formosum]|uniref:4-hydroxyphenylpyruvate dioxygenase n=1 Tax=Kamptonema formosum TaxID=331992 RepID=UPI000344F495|nr:4-hydroxyphenylpyruvate dioxygenase [Oscillatoria sp. PCC 10802]
MEIDLVHFCVEDATACRDWFASQMGFQAIAGAASNHTRTEIVKSGPVCFVLSSPLTPASPAHRFLARHPAGVADVAFRVADIESVMAKAAGAGAKILQPVRQQQTPGGRLKWGKIAGWGDLSHTIIERTGITPLLPPATDFPFPNLPFLKEGSEGSVEGVPVTNDSPFTGTDHAVLNVAAGELEQAVTWYEKTLGFQRLQRFDIQTKRSGLSSLVMAHPSGGAQMPVNEPASANSQIQEFLDVNRGPGVQHIALRTGNIVRLLDLLRRWGVSFIEVPPTYYTQLQQRHRGQLPAALCQEIERAQVLVDWQEQAPDALLLQTFTQPIFGQPTFFFELIERRSGARGFGEGNFRALFEAIESEQLKRGR